MACFVPVFVLLSFCGRSEAGIATNAPAQNPADLGPIAPKPLYRDPVFDGAADPSTIWNPHVKRWWMFYTNRRANAPGLRGVTWVHGTRLGIAESADGGASWKYLGTAEIDLPPEFGGERRRNAKTVTALAARSQPTHSTPPRACRNDVHFLQ